MRIYSTFLVLLSLAQNNVFGLGLRQNDKLNRKLSILEQSVECDNGVVGVDGLSFGCNKIDFLSLLSNDDLKVIRESFADNLFDQTDIWGWLSPTGKEITMSCMTNAVIFIDSTDPLIPVVLGFVESPRVEDFFCDVKVSQNTAYITFGREVDNGEVTNGIQVLDLLRVDELVDSLPVKLEPDFVYQEHGPASGLSLDADSNLLVSSGAKGGNCGEGLHLIDISERLLPTFVGCAETSNKVNDATCVTYSGPDSDFTGNQICFAFTNRELLILDVTDKDNISELGSATTSSLTALTQGALNGDQDRLLASDIFDELSGKVNSATTYVVDVSSLTNPTFTGQFSSSSTTIDGNVFVWGDMIQKGQTGSIADTDGPIPDSNYAYCANFASGLRVLNTKGIKNNIPQLEEVGFFDTFSNLEDTSVIGSTSSFMHPSGVIAVSDIQTGVFFLRFQDAFLEPADPLPTVSPTIPPVTEAPVTEAPSTSSPTGTPSVASIEATGVDGLPFAFYVMYFCVFLCCIGVIIFNIKLFNDVPPPERKTNTQRENENNNNGTVRGSQINPMFSAESEQE